jgi:hypothetical protein
MLRSGRLREKRRNREVVMRQGSIFSRFKSEVSDYADHYILRASIEYP